MGAQASCASLSVMGEVDGGKAQGVEQCEMWPGDAAERKARRRRARSACGHGAQCGVFLRNCGA